MTAIKQEYKIGNITLYLGNSYEIIKELPEKSIDLIHTDPPYEMKGLNPEGMGKFGSMIYKKSVEKLADPEIIKGFDFNFLKEYERICKNINFQIWCNKAQVYSYLSYAEENEYKWQDIKLFRNNALPTVMGKYQDSDYCLHIWKGRTLTGKYENKRPYYFYNIGGTKEYNHPALKPLEPITNLLEVGSNENNLVLDPFMGSGTTGVACIRKNRKFIGIEVQEKYFEMAKQRIEKEYKQYNYGLLASFRKGE